MHIHIDQAFGVYNLSNILLRCIGYSQLCRKAFTSVLRCNYGTSACHLWHFFASTWKIV